MSEDKKNCSGCGNGESGHCGRFEKAPTGEEIADKAMVMAKQYRERYCQSALEFIERCKDRGCIPEQVVLDAMKYDGNLKTGHFSVYEYNVMESVLDLLHKGDEDDEEKRKDKRRTKKPDGWDEDDDEESEESYPRVVFVNGRGVSSGNLPSIEKTIRARIIRIIDSFDV